MVNRKPFGQGTVEFVIMLSVLTAIGILIMTQMTKAGPTSKDAIGVGADNAIAAIKND